MQPQYTPVPGDRVGSLTLVRDAGVVRGRRSWLCRCDCGKTVTVRANNLRSGNTRSCGCQQVLAVRVRSTTHGRTNSSAYWRWKAMIQRCTNPKNEQWTSYGGRGISVCERWRTFENFYADMGDPPAGLTLDRIDVNGNYEPSNCRWATPSRQARNMRKTPMLTFNGETLSLIDWAERLGINFRTLHSRLKKRGWTVERALTTPAERDEQ